MAVAHERAEPIQRAGRRAALGRTGIARREALTGLAFVSPWLVGFVLFTLLPMGAALWFSLTDFDLRRPEAARFVGLDNFVRLLSDPNVGQSLGVTVRFALLTVPLNLGLALGLAVLLNHRGVAARSLFRTMFYLPMQIPLVASTLIWAGVLNEQTGWLNRALGVVGIGGPDWLESPSWVLGALALMGVWEIGNMMVIFLAGLQGVPSELYDAARVDGAGRWTTFRRITLPLLSPVVLYNLLIGLILSFQYFTKAYVLTNGTGDPDDATLFYNLNLYREAFTYNQMGYGAALAWVLFVIVLGLTILLFASARRWVYYAGETR
ncbi:MAG TPA: sugar ABC transporter permease [Candidatus Limnocylindrales bacterium]|nr:sugar ABC transporter permease [Candidatus Limnocylindrales bacterium]